MFVPLPSCSPIYASHVWLEWKQLLGELDRWKISMTSLANFIGFLPLVLASAWQASGSLLDLARDSAYVLPHLVFTSMSQATSVNWVITVGIGLFSWKSDSQTFRVQEGYLIAWPLTCQLPFFYHVLSLEITSVYNSSQWFLEQSMELGIEYPPLHGRKQINLHIFHLCFWDGL